jgi:hypothetical protein
MAAACMQEGTRSELILDFTRRLKLYADLMPRAFPGMEALRRFFKKSAVARRASSIFLSGFMKQNIFGCAKLARCGYHVRRRRPDGNGCAGQRRHLQRQRDPDQRLRLAR